MPRIEIHASDRTKAESTYLRRFARNVTSEMGEDGMIARIFEIMPPTSRWCVEFGAGDGEASSNTWTLLNQQGWQGVLIERAPHRFAALARRYQGADNVHALNRMVAIEGSDCLDQVLAQTPIPTCFDLLSIDIDGNDWHVWQSLSEYRPRLVVVEFNPTIPNEILFVQDRDPTVNQGASLRAFIELAAAKGYELIATTAYNAFFVDRTEFARFGITDNSIDAMHSPAESATYFFQLFDGRIEVAGCRKLLWSGHAFTSDDVQVLPLEQRVYRG